MLQLKEQIGAQNFDECSFSQSNAQIQTCRYLQPSILNKSCMHAVSYHSCMLKELPDLPANTQKLDLSKNQLLHFPLGLMCLKQIKISHNLIERIPDQINDIASLRIIRANSNNISILPFLHHVRHLQLNNNPIKIITTKISQTRLQFISFDWLPYLIQTAFQTHEKNAVYALCDIIQSSKLDSMTYFVNFQTLFEHRKNNINDISYLTHKAIYLRSDWFVDFLKTQSCQINFNALLYMNRPLLQFALEQDYDSGLELFMTKKSNLNAPQVYMINLILACKHNHFKYFSYVVGHGLKRFVIAENQDQIIQEIFRNFDCDKRSLEMLEKIMYLANFNEVNKKSFKLPNRIFILQGQRICDGIVCVMQNKKLNQIFDFKTAVQGQQMQPLLHFAMSYRKPQLVKLILQRFRKPFITNHAGKTAKNIRGSVFSRKLIWKYQKMSIKQQFQNSQLQPQKKKPKQRQRWLNIVYSSPKNTKQMSSPSKQNQTQPQSLMGSQIHSIQKSIHQRKAIHKLKANRNKQEQNQQFDPFQCINDKDETGIIFDFTLNSSRKSNYFITNRLMKKMNKTVNSLSIYQTFQRSGLNTVQKDFTRKNACKRQERTSFLVSPFQACQDVTLSQNQHQEYIIKKQEQNERYSICPGPCNQVENSGDPSEYII